MMTKRIDSSHRDAARKKRIKEHMDSCAQVRDHWISKNRYFYQDHEQYMRFLVPKGLRVLLVGCGTGNLLNKLEPSFGVGVDISEGLISSAREKFPHLTFVCGDIEDRSTVEKIKGSFDVIIFSDVIGFMTDCEQTLGEFHGLCTQDTRVIITYYSWLWESILSLAEKLGLKMPQVELNWLSCEDIVNILHLADFDTVKFERRVLLPKKIFWLGKIINKYLATLPIVRRFNLRNYIIARSSRHIGLKNPSCSILIPCRNEQGNIENAVLRLPAFCDNIEVIFVEGNSQDDTYDEIQRVIKKYPERDIKVFKQDGKGKGDAVRKGFANATGDILMILDADLTVPPEDLPKFYKAISSGKGEYINGSRLVYPMEKQAMRFLNFWANSAFALLFSWLLNQRFTDTLCGTKVLTKKNYDMIVANREYFGNFDPFGDFDLIFGASKLNLKAIEVPIRYAAREYGETQISRFRHGLLLIRMVIFAFRKLKGF